jgi:hypothetical protein
MNTSSAREVLPQTPKFGIVFHLKTRENYQKILYKIINYILAVTKIKHYKLMLTLIFDQKLMSN